MLSRTARRRTAAVVLGASVAAGVTIWSTTALFTDQAQVTGNTFTTGTVHISATPTSAAFNVPAMMPGDVIYAPITVANTGTAQLRYSMVSTTDEGVLAGQLQLAAKTGLTAGNCNSANWSSGTALTLQGTALGATSPGQKTIGDATAGQQTGDRVLAASSSEVLCFQVTLPTSSSNTYEGLTDHATFTFNAEQTANN